MADVKLRVMLEYDHFITKHDLNAIIDEIDIIVEEFIHQELKRKWKLGGKRRSRRPELSYVGITGVYPACICLIIIIGAPVAVYVATHFKAGLSKSALARQLERTGVLVGDEVGRRLVGPLNERLAAFFRREDVAARNVRSVQVESVEEEANRSNHEEPSSETPRHRSTSE